MLVGLPILRRLLPIGGPQTEAAIVEGNMAEKFIVVWTIDGETMNVPHSTQDGALQQAETLFARARVRSGDRPTF